jgi:hypothetical protein
MAIIVAENFNFLDTAFADVKASLLARGYVFTTDMSIWNSGTIRTQVENGVTRPYLVTSSDYYANSGNTFNAFGLPLTNNTNPFYLSFRLKLNAPSASNMVEFGIDTQGSAALGANRLLRVFNTGGQLQIFPGSGTSASVGGKYIVMPYNQWVMIEVFRAADGKVKVWVDDMLLLGASNFVNTAPVAANPRVYLGPFRNGNFIQGRYEWLISDLVLVDAALPGQQNRVGSTGRVESVPYTADVTAEWAPPAGVTDPHNTLMTSWKSVPDTTKILTGTVAGQREKYQVGAVPKSRADNDVVLAVGIERRANNAGGAAHTFASEIDLGAGNVEVDSVTLAAGAGYQYIPKFMDKKPDGSNWTMADVAAMKSGFVVKS